MQAKVVYFLSCRCTDCYAQVSASRNTKTNTDEGRGRKGDSSGRMEFDDSFQLGVRIFVKCAYTYMYIYYAIDNQSEEKLNLPKLNKSFSKVFGFNQPVDAHYNEEGGENEIWDPMKIAEEPVTEKVSIYRAYTTGLFKRMNRYTGIFISFHAIKIKYFNFSSI